MATIFNLSEEATHNTISISYLDNFLNLYTPIIIPIQVDMLCGLWVVFTCVFRVSWTANCFSAEPYIDFSDKPFMGGTQVCFYDPICPILAAFSKGVKIMVKELSQPKINVIFGLSTSWSSLNLMFTSSLTDQNY